ncbi:hypothetical protein GCM10022224_064700 [Nonomuraea antimicrobica]|uniref:histidine kinase n=1 Tax=Nonomuraea antimicrobica TaxID=561173 RepID=A0ABP7CJY7_9ACTN
MDVWRDWTVRTRMTVLSTAVMALTCVGLVMLGLGLLRAHDMSHRVYSAYHRLGEVVFENAHRSVPPVIRQTRGLSAVQVVDPSGRVVAASPSLVGRPRLASFHPPARSRGGADRVLCQLPGLDGCMIVNALWLPDAAHRELLIYGFTPATPWYVNPFTLLVLLGSAGTIVAVAGFGISHVVGRTLRPVQAIRTALAEITTTDPGKRVPVPARHDEIWHLAMTVNQTLALLEAAFQRERQFTSDASHDLRTPIAAMRLRVEEAMLSRDPADWSRVGESLLAGLERLQAIVTDLLVISRLDAAAVKPTEVVNLSELVTDEVSSRAARQRLISVIEPGIMIAADALDCRRLLANLLDNAERHAASAVTVRVTRDNRDAVLEVADDGPGVPPDQRETIFHRFVRLADSRAKDAGGTGLGLAIARQIAESHHGALTLADSDEGARFVATFPLYRAAVEDEREGDPAAPDASHPRRTTHDVS